MFGKYCQVLKTVSGRVRFCPGYLWDEILGAGSDLVFPFCTAEHSIVEERIPISLGSGHISITLDNTCVLLHFLKEFIDCIRGYGENVGPDCDVLCVTGQLLDDGYEWGHVHISSAYRIIPVFDCYTNCGSSNKIPWSRKFRQPLAGWGGHLECEEVWRDVCKYVFEYECACKLGERERILREIELGTIWTVLIPSSIPSSQARTTLWMLWGGQGCHPPSDSEIRCAVISNGLSY